MSSIPFRPLLMLAVVALAFLVAPSAVEATHAPADKVAVAGGSIEVRSTSLVEGASSEEFVLLSGLMKTSGPTDLVLQVTLECALWTAVTTVGNDESESSARIDVWVEVDGVPVAVSADDTVSPGKVTFCDRTHRMKTLDFDDEDARIEQYLRTKSANAFNWILLDAGAGMHDIVVKARVDAKVTGAGDAFGAVGKRTLVVEPVKLANDATL